MVTRLVLSKYTVVIATLLTTSYAYADSPFHGAMLRLEFDGQLDATFGSSGTVETDVPNGTELFSTGVPVTVSSLNDRILAGGGFSNSSTHRLLLARYHTNGTLDTAWGNGGFVINDVPGYAYEEIWRMAVDGNGRIVALGSVGTSMGRYSILVARFNANGSFDTSFGSSGRVIINATSSSSDMPSVGLALLSSGKIVVGGYSGTAPEFSNAKALLVRLNSNGTLDTSFGTNGKVVSSLPGSSIWALNDLAIDYMGRIVATGYTLSGGVYRATMARYTTSGALDGSFNSTGFRQVTFPNRPGHAMCTRVVVDMSTNYTFGCASINPSSSAFEFAIVRLSSTGAYDTFFDGDGRVVTSIGSLPGAYDAPTKILFPLNIFAPAMIVVGNQISADSANQSFVAIGYNPDGSLAAGWGNGGIVYEQMPGSNSSPFADAFTLGDGRVTAFGWVNDPNP